MSVDGTWKLTINSPMGAQETTLTAKAQGATLTGTTKSAMGEAEIKDGKVDGGKVSFSVDVSQPMPMTLEFGLTADGDKMNGDVKAGAFGTFAVTGERVA